MQAYEAAHNNTCMDLKDRLKAARARKGLKQQQLAEKSGVDQTTISRLENGKQSGSGYITKIAYALGVNPHWLATGEGTMEAGTQDGGASYQVERNVGPPPKLEGMCPEISWVQAGQWQEVCHVDLDPESVNWYPRPPNAGPETFVLRVVGDSMLPEYPPGRIIYVDPERIAQSGDDVVAVLTDSNEATFKRLVEEPGSGRLLKALNPGWHDPYLPINGNCRILGVVVADMRLR